MLDTLSEFLSSETYREFTTLLKTGGDDDRLRTIIRDEFLPEFDFDNEVNFNISYAMDRLFDDLEDDGFSDDLAVMKHLQKGRPEVTEYLKEGFTEGFGIAILMDLLGMHDESVEFVTAIVDTIDDSLRKQEYQHKYMSDGLAHISSIMHESLSNGDALGWMDPDTKDVLKKWYKSQ